MKTLFTNLDQAKTDLILLILASQDIPAMSRPMELPSDTINEQRVGQEKPQPLFSLPIEILVSRENQARALFHVNRYFTENRPSLCREPEAKFQTAAFFSPTALIIMAMLPGIHYLFQTLGIHQEMILKWGASALFIFQGDTFRGITALLVHADWGHVLGNMGGILIFGAPLIRVSGYGTGPLLLLTAGATGNLINAWVQGSARLSIGASTAVMGAAGSLVAFQMTRKIVRDRPPIKIRSMVWNRLVPFFAGTTLVAMFSQGENTDVTAHLFGFLAGFFAGLLFFPFHRVFLHRFKEPVALFISILILAGAILASGLP